MKTYESFVQKIKDKLNTKKETLNKSNYTHETFAPSKIDPSKKVIIKSWMECPKCKNTLKDMDHGEIQKCNKCKTILQVFGNGLHVNDITENPYSQTRYQKFTKNLTDVDYSGGWIKEELTKSDYTRGKQMYCPLCSHILDKIEHGETKICPECTLKMTNYGNLLKCEIDEKNLEYHGDIAKYNL